MKYFSLIALLLCLACSNQPQRNVVCLEVERVDFQIAVEGTGQLRAVKAIPIQGPMNNSSNTLAWIAEEGSFVHKGDQVAVFDATDFKVREEKVANDLKSIDHRVNIEVRNNDVVTYDLDGQIDLLHQERQQALNFAPKNQLLYTRNQIIESEVDIKFLNTKVDYFGGKKDRQTRKATTDQEIQELNRKSQQIILSQVRDSLKNLVIVAPNDGYFYPERFRGEPVKVGQQVWPGMKIGEIPDMSSVEARVDVLEKEAAGIKSDLEAEITIDSRPGYPFKARVKQVAALAKPLNRVSPVKYFEVILSLEATDSEFMRQGGFATARIVIDHQENVIALPNQIFFHDDKTNWVYVQKSNGSFEKRTVTLGRRGPNRTIVETGLEPGERVAMSDPTQEAKP